MKGPLRSLCLLLALSCSSLPGCGTLLESPAKVPIRTFELTPRIEVASERAGSLVLYVSPVRSNPVHATTQISYRKHSYEVSAFTQSEWAAEPARQLETWLIAALESSGAYRAVVSGASAPPADRRLDVEIITLLHEFDVAPSRVRISLRAQIIDSVSRSVLATERFEEVAPAPTEDAYGGVMAANRALERLLADIAAFCARYAR